MSQVTDVTTEEQYLGSEEILGANDIKFAVVPVPEWGGKVRVKGLSGSERDAYEQSIMILRKGGNYVPNLENARAKLVVRCVVDKDGKKLFSEANIVALGAKNAAALQRVFQKARELSGLTEDDMEELVGNSETDPSEGSTSD